MVKTLNIAFDDKEIRVLRKAYENFDAESWPKLFLALAMDFNERVEGGR